MRFTIRPDAWRFRRLATLAAAGCAVCAAALAQPIASEEARYFIEFRARPSSYIGHTFIIYGRTGSDGRVTESHYAGLIPERAAWRGVFFPIRGSVQKYKDDTRLPTRVIYRRPLSATEFARVNLAVRQMRASADKWHALFFNCNDFAIEIAEAIGLRRPPSLMPPEAWVSTLRAMNQR